MIADDAIPLCACPQRLPEPVLVFDRLDGIPEEVTRLCALCLGEVLTAREQLDRLTARWKCSDLGTFIISKADHAEYVALVKRCKEEKAAADMRKRAVA